MSGDASVGSKSLTRQRVERGRSHGIVSHPQICHSQGRLAELADKAKLRRRYAGLLLPCVGPGHCQRKDSPNVLRGDQAPEAVAVQHALMQVGQKADVIIPRDIAIMGQ